MTDSKREDPRPDPEVPERAKRRRFTAEYKLRIVQEASRCGAGELGALLRREGLYSSHLSKWREQLDAGALRVSDPGSTSLLIDDPELFRIDAAG